LNLPHPCPPPPDVLLNTSVSLRRFTKEQLENFRHHLRPVTEYTLGLNQGSLTREDLITHTDFILGHVQSSLRHVLDQGGHVRKLSASQRKIHRLRTQWVHAPPGRRTALLDEYHRALVEEEGKGRGKRIRAAKAALARGEGYRRALGAVDGVSPPPSAFRDSTGTLFTDPANLCRLAEETYSSQGGDPNFQVDWSKINDVLSHCKPILSPRPLPPPTLREFRKILKGGKKKRSCGPDSTNMFIIFHLPPPLLNFLHYAISSLWDGEFPDHWKTSLIKMLHKKGSPYSVANFRPISLLNTLYKVIMKHTHNHIMSELVDNRIIDESQHGFRAKMTCLDHAFELTARMDLERHPAYLILFDFAKAFDSTVHDVLWRIMELTNLHPSVIRIVKEMYTNARDFPVVNGYTGSGYMVGRGVRQGCPLSPTLFLLFLNPLLSYINHSINSTGDSMMAFADDLALYAPIHPATCVTPGDHSWPTHCPQSLATATTILVEEGGAMGLSLSLPKTVILPVFNPPPPHFHHS
jgi:hypothetical protein